MRSKLEIESKAKKSASGFSEREHGRTWRRKPVQNIVLLKEFTAKVNDKWR